MEQRSEPSSDWDHLLEAAIQAERQARRLARSASAGTREQAAGAATATRLHEFIHDVRLAMGRRRTNVAAYRSVFEQIVPPIRAAAGG
jgi:hypothetical protein